jgi:hypothetical protein
MKKVLIIANLFHASPRIPGLAKYLPEFGWQPIILTTPLGEDPHLRYAGPPADFIKSGVRIIETPTSVVLGFWKKLFGFNSREDVGEQIKTKFNLTFEKPSYRFLSWLYRKGQAIVNYPDAETGWKPYAVEAGDELLQNEDIDAMISSSSPVTSHLIARELKIKHKLHWVADLRDLWTQNHTYGYGPLRMSFERKLELKTLSAADALVTVSALWSEELSRLHKGKTIHTITNGFDPDKLSKGLIDLTSKFTITYTGLIYTGKQDPSKLFAALHDLISNGTINPRDIEVRFYGPKIEWLPREIEGYGLSEIVKHYGPVPRESSFEKQKESQLLLLFNWNDHRVRGWYPLKIFEYLAAQRPILAAGGFGDDVVEKLLDETKAGVYAPTTEDIKSALKELYLEYIEKGKIRYRGEIEKINKYSYREMSRKFAEVFDSLI